MSDLTVIFLTEGRLPGGFMEYQRGVLMGAIGDSELVTISRKPLDMGRGTNLIQKEARSRSNVYWQILRAARMAKTDYVAMAEDDVLYPKKHFSYRPADDVFAYNNSHWSLFTWGQPTYHWTDRVGNYSLIANRRLVVRTLEKIFRKFPEGTPEQRTGELGRAKTQLDLGVRQKPAVKFFTEVPIIIYHHDRGFDDLAKRKRKRMGMMRAYDIPHWGRAEDLVERFK